MAELQLLLRDGGNRHALASVLADHHTLVADGDLQDADLFIVDEPAFPAYRASLERYQHEQQPVFCPVLLIRRERSPTTIDLPDPAAETEPFLVDEILTAPVDKQTLRRAVANLLARRRQTEQLQERTAQLEELASTLRHELRNPLNLLTLSLDTARNANLPEALDRCQRAVDRMERMLEETLLIVEQGNIDITFEPVDIETVARECWDIVFDSDAELRIETDQQILADEMRLRQLLENLFRNAVEHGGTDVTVTVGPLDGGIVIEDDGLGIPEADHDRVFEEGYTTSKAGSGLGLAVVRAVADAHGWAVRVTTGRDGGARFEITGIETNPVDAEP